MVEEKDRGISALEGEVRRVEGVAASINTDLDRALAETSELGATLGARDQEVAALRADLADRWRNFLRAISIGKPGG